MSTASDSNYISLRDQLAMAALILVPRDLSAEEQAVIAYGVADEMLREREVDAE